MILRFQPTKVLAIYTFTRRCPLEETEKAMRKTMGFSTVSHFNLVHVECHMAAVRQVQLFYYLITLICQNNFLYFSVLLFNVPSILLKYSFSG